MKARFVCLAIAVWSALVACRATTAQDYWQSGDGVASVPGGAYSPPIGPDQYASGYPSGYGKFGKVPLTPSFEDGPARWNYGDISSDRGGLYEDSPFDEFAKDLFTDAFFRLEYLNFTMKRPGDVLLGSPTASSLTPKRPFQVSSGNQLLGEARVLSTENLDIDNLNGIRATLGIPLISGSIEGSIFSLEEGFDRDGVTSGLGAPPPGNPVALPQFVGTTTFTNGQLGTNIFLYDNSLVMSFSNRVWGSDINYVWEAYDPNHGLQLRPLMGFRYYGQDESFNQIGVFDQQGQLPDPLVSTINSSSRNQAYLGQIGLRAELVSRWLTLGIEPKLGIGVNNYESSVITTALRSPGDPTVFTTDSGSKVSPFGELAVYGRANVSQNVSFILGYSLFVIDNVTRPHSSIYYNDNGQNLPAGVVVRPSFDKMHFQGVNLGAEIRF